MTMPVLMNCGHLPDGICLQCVGKIVQSLQADLKEGAKDYCDLRDREDSLRVRLEKAEWLLDRAAGTADALGHFKLANDIRTYLSQPKG